MANEPMRDTQTDADRKGRYEIGKRAQDITTNKPPTGDIQPVETC